MRVNIVLICKSDRDMQTQKQGLLDNTGSFEIVSAEQEKKNEADSGRTLE
jgi:hypothetical protein